MEKQRIVNLLREEELMVTNPTYAMAVNIIMNLDCKEEEVMAELIHSLRYGDDEVRKELIDYKVIYGELKDNGS